MRKIFIIFSLFVFYSVATMADDYETQKRISYSVVEVSAPTENVENNVSLFFSPIVALFVLLFFALPSALSIILYRRSEPIKLLTCFLISFYLNWLGFLLVIFLIKREKRENTRGL